MRISAYDPKERVIAVAPFRDRVVHHAIVGVLTPIYERVFIYDSYATRPGKGTHVAILRAQSFLRRWKWYFKTDMSKYFGLFEISRDEPGVLKRSFSMVLPLRSVQRAGQKHVQRRMWVGSARWTLRLPTRAKASLQHS